MPFGNRIEQPVLPFDRLGGGKFLNLFREPAGGGGARLRVVVQPQNERADFFIATAAVDLDQGLDGDGKFIFAFVMRLKLLGQRFTGELAGFAFVEDGDLRVEAKLVKVLAHEAQAKAVQRADVRNVEERELVRPMVVGGRGGGFVFEFAAKALAQLGGGGLGESDDEQFVERRAFAFEAVEAAGHERLGFPGARAGHDEDVAALFHGFLL